MHFSPLSSYTIHDLEKTRQNIKCVFCILQNCYKLKERLKHCSLSFYFFQTYMYTHSHSLFLLTYAHTETHCICISLLSNTHTHKLIHTHSPTMLQFLYYFSIALSDECHTSVKSDHCTTLNFIRPSSYNNYHILTRKENQTK